MHFSRLSKTLIPIFHQPSRLQRGSPPANKLVRTYQQKGDYSVQYMYVV